ncbi:sugar transporter [Arenimonas maotaiensis]|uniref:Sugar transporter n=1 Tax=Arenimonas maotaiensis TaxID=1446479 RepID=A0A917FMW4_9GAMM|nr:TonB-dependent hemoglobin/transferrin/lactoferrin family receptor [Arenimonas maotaiensis]GGF93339.1 sugar transporter [Arenimonas maotaiensis]
MRHPLAAAIALVLCQSAQAQTPPREADLLDSVVVVGQRRPEPIEQVVGAVSRLDREQFQRRGVQDIKDMVRYTPSVEVTQDANRFGSQGFNIRGLEGNRVSIEIDGVPLPDAFSVGQFASAGRDLVELGVIDRVEILRGPASTLYGSKALAGVVAYHTLDPATADFSGRAWRVGASLGTQSRDDSQRWAAQWMTQGGDGRFDLLLAAGRRSGHETANAAEVPGDRANPADYTRDSAMLKAGIDLAEAGRWQIAFDRSQGRQLTDVQSLLFGPGRFSTTYALTGDDRYTRDRISLQGSVPAVGAFSDVSVLLYRQDSRTRQASEQYRLADRTTRFPSLRERDFHLDQTSIGLELNAQWRGHWLGVEHWQIVGVDAARHDYRSIRYGTEVNLNTGAESQVILGEVLPVRDFPNSRGEEFGLFWQDEIRLAPAWALVPGLRWERQRTRGYSDAVWAADNPGAAIAATESEAFTPKLGLRWQGGDWSSYLQYVRGFRAPPFSDVNIGLNLPAFNYVALPNPDLKPERSHGLEWGLRYGNGPLQASVALYDNRFRDLIESRANRGVNGDGQLVFQSINRDTARIVGAEFDARLGLDAFWPQAEDWQLLASGSWSRGDDTGRDLPLNSIMPARASLGLGYAPGHGRWGAELLGTGVARVSRVDRSSANLFAPPGYAVLDANVWLAVTPELRLNLSFGNLADRRYWQWASMRGALATATDLDFYSASGRSYAISLNGDW